MIIKIRDTELNPENIINIDVKLIPDGYGDDLGYGLWIKQHQGDDIKIPIGSENESLSAKQELVKELRKLGLYHSINV